MRNLFYGKDILSVFVSPLILKLEIYTTF
ncbi:uncharacterized protein METZ01_LOCUS139223 [marine metagenome]|uniref:Uncharacterized protein n=1 Tax=marine metagenome TaxID=408172 RepID=A0A381ZB06_9ZZZZ